ncbi:MAG: type II toxin-antitoxin system RelE/ParE family toxin [Pyrinomonadaceae bacterium]
MRINILRSAQNDLDDGYIFYEEREEGVGEYFLRSLHQDMLSLKTLAGTHQKVGRYFRKHASSFPHAIYYTIEDNEVRVCAVIDSRRDPVSISDRLN